MRGESKASKARFQGALHTVRAFEVTHLPDGERVHAELSRLLELIGKKRGETDRKAMSRARWKAARRRTPLVRRRNDSSGRV